MQTLYCRSLCCIETSMDTIDWHARKQQEPSPKAHPGAKLTQSSCCLTSSSQNSMCQIGVEENNAELSMCKWGILERPITHSVWCLCVCILVFGCFWWAISVVIQSALWSWLEEIRWFIQQFIRHSPMQSLKWIPRGGSKRPCCIVWACCCVRAALLNMEQGHLDAQSRGDLG